MNYPVWQLNFWGGGSLIALIAILHVYISHFAVGGGLFLVVTEHWAARRNDQKVLAYLKVHARFFLLLTMVLGAITGVGIWFTIALLHPATTSILIHTFVFGWAIEWVFFLGEIVALFIYYYAFDRMDRRTHLLMGWLYFAFAWLSLFVINGIIDFMLTPGNWPVSHDFWDGFFNPTFWPSLAFRTFLALVLAGLYGFVTTSWLKDEQLRQRLARYCALWLLAPFLLLLLAGLWYVQALPEPIRNWFLRQPPELVPFCTTFLVITPVIFLAGLAMTIRLPALAGKGLAVLLLVIGLLYMGSFEYIREGSRKPYTIQQVLYSNSLRPAELPTVRRNGILASARWVSAKRITAANQLQLGRELFNLMCLSCHSIGGPTRDIKKYAGRYQNLDALADRIGGTGYLHSSMPPFVGTEAERYALARFISRRLLRRGPAPPPPPLAREHHTVPPFDPARDRYLLLAWSDLGVRNLAATPLWSLRPPGSTLYALLIRRGPTPEIVSSEVTLRYRPAGAPDNQAPPRGQSLAGDMQPVQDQRFFASERLGLLPRDRNGGYQPYPLFVIEARNAKNNTLLAATKVVAPVADELGCRNCHGGPWRDQESGISDQTAAAVLAVHDRLSKTRLATRALGERIRCQSCHPDPGHGREKTGGLSLSAAIHGFHAPLFRGQGNSACGNCHPSAPHGPTRFYRGLHQELGLDCSDCHGTMEQHALALLKGESDRPHADRLIARIRAQDPATTPIDRIQPRQPWIAEPDCLTCHQNFQPPEQDSAFNHWTAGAEDLFRNRTDEMGIPCAACHNSPHVIFPARNPYDPERDNLLPRQYQGNPYPLGANRNCRLCHTVNMEEEMHHPNSLASFRNQR